MPISATHPDAVSCVLRFHDPARLGTLSRALLSLARQDYPVVEPIVVLQGFDPAAVKAVELSLAGIAWPRTFLPAKVVNVATPPQGDHRARLANDGIAARSGRYLAFLDYDDLLYPECYRTLVAALRDSGAAAAFGGVMLSIADAGDESGAVLRRHPIYDGRMKYDVFAKNQHPIHSFVLDTSRIRPELLRFDVGLSRNEDYGFLLAILAECEWDTSAAGTPLCEYVQWSGRAYSIARMEDADRAAWAKGEEEIRSLLKRLSLRITASDLRDIVVAPSLDARILMRSMPRAGNHALGLLQATTAWDVEGMERGEGGRLTVRGWLADERGDPAFLVFIYRRRFGVLTLIGAGPACIERKDIAQKLGASSGSDRYGFEIVCRSPDRLKPSGLLVAGCSRNGMIVGRRRLSPLKGLMQSVRAK